MRLISLDCVTCDAIKQNESELKQNENWLLHASMSELSYAETPSKLNIWFQRYRHYSAPQNSKIQRKLNTIIGSIWKSILASSDSFCLITSHMMAGFFHNSVYYTFISHSGLACSGYWSNMDSCLWWENADHIVSSARIISRKLLFCFCLLVYLSSHLIWCEFGKCFIIAIDLCLYFIDII